MRKIVFAVAALLLAVAPPAWAAQAKAKQAKGVQVAVAKLVGVWAPAKSQKGAASTTQGLEFTRDGKLKVSGQTTVGGKVKKFQSQGTYKVVKGGFTVTAQGPNGKDQTQTITVTKLTDNELVTRNDTGAVSTFKKKGGASGVTQKGRTAQKAATAKAAGKKASAAKASSKKRGPVVNPDGSFTNPDGSLNLTNDPQALAELSGEVPPGTVVNPDGSFTNPDGSLNLTFDKQALAQLFGGGSGAATPPK
jgi:uncharacterized protein (TIGR03066 family)